MPAQKPQAPAQQSQEASLPAQFPQDKPSENSASLEDETPVPDLLKVAKDQPICPSEDVKTYGELIRKVAAALGLPLTKPKLQVEDAIFDILHRDVSTPVSLLLSSILLQSIQNAWSISASAPTSTKRLDHMYRVQESSAAFLYTHPKLNSLIVTSTVKGKGYHSAPQDRDGKKIDMYGRRFYSTGALGIKAANYIACISRFVFGILEDFTPLLTMLPEEHRLCLTSRHADGLVATKQLLSSSKYVLESAARTLSSAVALQRFAWLHSTTLPFDTKTLVEDLPFDGQGLFNADTDNRLRRIDKDIKASKSLGIAPKPLFKRKPDKQWQRTGRSPDRYGRTTTSSSSRSPFQARPRFQQNKRQKPKAAKQSKPAP